MNRTYRENAEALGQGRLEKAMAQSGPVDQSKSPAASRRMILGLAVLALAVGFLAWPLYETGNANTFRSVLASNLLQGVAIAVGVIVIGWLVGRSADRQADRLELDRKRQADKLEADRKRLELLQRMRAAHVSIAHAQRLLRAEDNDTYMKQMRALMLVARDLEEIREDVKVTEGLYEGNDRCSIMKGIAEIIEFLERGNREYVAWRNGERSQSERDYRRLEWVADLIKERGRPDGSSKDTGNENWAPPDRMPDEYEDGLKFSKAKMRAYVYGELKPRI